ncbi:MAG: YcjX family protein, partial [Acetobacteraceae bacterium]|nr:YcjX family protein [Acetobacteraceae bacterium]
MAFDPLEELLGTARALRAVLLGPPQQRVRLALTGLSRAGKTVFATALSANLLAAARDPRRLSRLPAAAEGRIAAVREAASEGTRAFPLADAFAALAAAAAWPRPTTRLSALALELEIEATGTAWLERETGNTRRMVQLELVDYPGEWLLDLPLLEMSFEEWSARELLRAEAPARAPRAAAWRAALGRLDPAAAADPAAVAPVVAQFRNYLGACREA